jgi:penicillin G amidase
VASLKKQFGLDLEKWRWKNINKLEISSLASVKLFDRAAGPAFGTAFTVNPGSNIGTVNGGASWRMIVDFGDTAGSVGVYPGGQSESPFSPLYGDQMSLWSKGSYVPLWSIGDAEKLPAKAKTRHVLFEPKS